jgi:hypothetical protein
MGVNVGGWSAALIARITLTGQLINTNQLGKSSAHSAAPGWLPTRPPPGGKHRPDRSLVAAEEAHGVEPTDHGARLRTTHGYRDYGARACAVVALRLLTAGDGATHPERRPRAPSVDLVQLAGRQLRGASRPEIDQQVLAVTASAHGRPTRSRRNLSVGLWSRTLPL